MQGLRCCSEYSFDQTSTGRESIFTPPSRVKNALAFLHKVFTNLFEQWRLIFNLRGVVARLCFLGVSHPSSVSTRLFCAKLRAVTPCNNVRKSSALAREECVKIRKPFVCSMICLVIVALTSAAAFADTIRLRDGSVLKGKVVSYSNRKFTIVVYIGGSSSQHLIPVEEIESVEFDSSDVGTVSRADPQ